MSLYAVHCSCIHALLCTVLIVGNTPCDAESLQKGGMHCSPLTHDEERSQMAIWAITSSPLLMSNDLRNVSAASKAILQNPHLLAVNQDPLGRMARRFLKDPATGAQGWSKQLADGSVAVALYNAGSPTPAPMPPMPSPQQCAAAAGAPPMWTRTSGAYRESCGGASGNAWPAPSR